MLCLSGFELYSRWVPLFTSITHDCNSTANLEVDGTIICHRFFGKGKTRKVREIFYTVSFKPFANNSSH